MNIQRTVRQTAQAFFTAASKADLIRETSARLISIQEVLKSTPKFKHLLHTKRITAAQKQQILKVVLKDLITDFEIALINVLIEKDAISLLSDVILGFQKLAASDPRYVRVTISTSNVLDKSEVDEIVTRLEKLLKKHVDAKSVVSPDLIGGMRLRIGNTIVDGSISRRLEKLRESLIRVS